MTYSQSIEVPYPFKSAGSGIKLAAVKTELQAFRDKNPLLEECVLFTINGEMTADKYLSVLCDIVDIMEEVVDYGVKCGWNGDRQQVCSGGRVACS